MQYSVGQVAAVAGVSVRTLHHYDQIGLLQPSARSAAGYRLYDDADVDRLHQVVFYRGLGFSLDEVAAVLDNRSVSATEHLRRHAICSASGSARSRTCGWPSTDNWRHAAWASS